MRSQIVDGNIILPGDSLQRCIVECLIFLQEMNELSCFDNAAWRAEDECKEWAKFGKCEDETTRFGVSCVIFKLFIINSNFIKCHVDILSK